MCIRDSLYTGLELNSTVSSIRPGGLLVYQVTFGNAGQGLSLIHIFRTLREIDLKSLRRAAEASFRLYLCGRCV